VLCQRVYSEHYSTADAKSGGRRALTLTQDRPGPRHSTTPHSTPRRTRAGRLCPQYVAHVLFAMWGCRCRAGPARHGRRAATGAAAGRRPLWGAGRAVLHAAPAVALQPGAVQAAHLLVRATVCGGCSCPCLRLTCSCVCVCMTVHACACPRVHAEAHAHAHAFTGLLV